MNVHIHAIRYQLSQISRYSKYRKYFYKNNKSNLRFKCAEILLNQSFFWKCLIDGNKLFLNLYLIPIRTCYQQFQIQNHPPKSNFQNQFLMNNVL